MPAPVSIGMPVFNGATRPGPGVVQAIDSILGQSFSDFEFIISDNASTDATEEICRTYAARDARIKYIRQDANIGSTANFEQLLTRATGTLFMWAAADDVRDRRFLETALQCLSDDPDAVLAISDLAVVNVETGKTWRRTFGSGIKDPDPRIRYRSIVRQGAWHAIYGLIRREALLRTRRYSTMRHLTSFGVAPDYRVVELGLQGRFAHVPEPLLQIAVRSPVTEEELVRALDSTASIMNRTGFARLFADLWLLTGRYGLRMRDRLRLQAEFLQSAKTPGSLGHALMRQSRRAELTAMAQDNWLLAQWIRQERAMFLQPRRTPD